MKRLAFLTIVAAACITTVFVNALKPNSTSAFMFIAAWLTLPYILMCAALIFIERKGKASFHWYVVATIVSAGGVLFLADIIFWHPDAQGAIALLMTPVLQGGALAFLLPVTRWVSRNTRT